jgi:hypothetical protein
MNCIWRRLPSKLVIFFGFCDRGQQLSGQACRRSAQREQGLAQSLFLVGFCRQLGLAGRPDFFGAISSRFLKRPLDQ